MRRAECLINTKIAGVNTGASCRAGKSNTSKILGYVTAKKCVDNKFYVDLDDSTWNGTKGYAKLLEAGKLKLNGYVYIGLDYLIHVKEVNTGAGKDKPKKQLKTQKEQPKEKQPTTIPIKTTDEKLDSPETEKRANGFDSTYTNMLRSRRDLKFFVKNTRVFGAPHQFLESTDMRPFKESEVGREYLENILLEAPIVYFIPGLPKYMPMIDDNGKAKIEEYAKSVQENTQVSEDILKNVFNVTGKYFDFFPTYYEYMRYVNLLCRSCAVFMGIGGEKVPWGDKNQTYATYDWSMYANIFATEESTKVNKGGSYNGSIFEAVGGLINGNTQPAAEFVRNNFMGDFYSVKFYCEPSLSVSNSVSNSTKDPVVKSYFDSFEGVAKDVLFLTGNNRAGNGLKDLADTLGGAFSNTADTLNKWRDKATTDNTLGKVISMAGDVLVGANVVFPELYSASSSSDSYNISITLTSPYGNVESKYLHVIVPLMFLYGLAYPRQLNNNNYESPFLIKTYIPGMGTCEMGLIDSFSVDRVTESRSIDGVATQVRVSIGIKDLYKDLSITKTTAPGRFLSNTGLVEHLMVHCGVDLIKPNLELKAYSILNTVKNAYLTDVPTNITSSTIDFVRNRLTGVLHTALLGFGGL